MLKKEKKNDTVAYLVVVRSVDIPGHSKIRDLYNKTSTHKAIPSSNVSVNKSQSLQVLHTSGTL